MKSLFIQLIFMLPLEQLGKRDNFLALGGDMEVMEVTEDSDEDSVATEDMVDSEEDSVDTEATDFTDVRLYFNF